MERMQEELDIFFLITKGAGWRGQRGKMKVICNTINKKFKKIQKEKAKKFFFI